MSGGICVVLRARRPLARIHPSAYGAVYFGPSAPPPVNRYDAADSRFGVLYAGLTLKACVGEILVRNPARPYILTSEIASRSSALLRTTRELRLAALHDERMSICGMSLTQLVADDYGATQVLACHIYDTVPAVDGILYPSRFSNRPCVALFDRASSAVEQVGASRALRIEQIESIVRTFGKIVADDSV